MRLEQLADLLRCRLEGDGAVDVVRVAGLETAGPGDVTFLANHRYARRVGTTRASAIIADDHLSGAPCAVLRSTNPYLAMAEAIAVLSPAPRPAPGISPHAVVDPSSEIGPGVSVGPFVTIAARARIGARSVLHPQVVVAEDAVVGADCLIHARVSLRERVQLGDRVVVQDGAVIGSDGFGFAHRADGSHRKIPQMGTVVIEEDVEIGALSAIDRPAFGETRIAAGAKIDNLVQVGHGVKIGRNSLLAAQVGIAGSTVVEENVTFAGQSGAVGHVHIGRGALLTGKSGAAADVPAGAHISGFPGIDRAVWRRAVLLFARLPELARRIAALEARMNKR